MTGAPRPATVVAMSTPHDDRRTLVPAPDHPTALEGDGVFPGYTDAGHVGEGGMSEVRRLHDPSLGRDVAAKVLAERLIAQPSIALSLVREARLTARLEHPHIVPVHARGETTAGIPYFTMKLVDGVTLGDWLREHGVQPGVPPRGPALSDALEVFLKVCDAVSFAHAQGVLHRDIKPSNIMVGRYGEVYLMDWGLGIRVEECVGQPVIGTPAYMSPEQARREPLDERSDLFSLGCVLYHILAGESAWPEQLPHHLLLREVAAGNWIDLDRRALSPRPPASLSGIVRRAMAPERELRYASVAEFAGDLRAFLRSGLHLPEVTYPAGQAIVREGEPGSTAYLITEGRAVAWIRTAQGRRNVRALGPGDVFGELAILTAGRRTATVEAETDVRAQVVSREMLESGLGMQSWVGAFVRTLVQRFAELEAQIRGD